MEEPAAKKQKTEDGEAATAAAVLEPEEKEQDAVKTKGVTWIC